MRLACVCVRDLRSVSACALPRPSAIASAKLANSTVNQSQSVICSVKPRCAAPVTTSRTSTSVVSTLPISTTNMTGFRTMWRGASLMNESRIARRTIGGSKSGRAVAAMERVALEELPGLHEQVLDDRAERERREERERRRRSG